MEFVELDSLSLRDWIYLTERRPAPFGETTARLVFRPKTHYVGIRNGDGRLVAAGGVTIATVEVAGRHAFDVVGMGGLILRTELRGRGLAGPLMDRLAARAAQLGPDRAMLFCEPGLVDRYARRDFRLISAPVRADQPDGQIVVPVAAMWRPLRPATWPPGAVRVDGLLF